MTPLDALKALRAEIDAQIAELTQPDPDEGITFADIRADHEAELEMHRALNRREAVNA